MNRIVILADPLDNQQAGIHYYTRDMVQHIAKIDQESQYYILRRKKDDLFPADRQIIVKNYRFPGYSALRLFCIIPWKLRKLKADIVVEPAHFGPFNLPTKMKRVTVIHDLTPILMPQYHRFHSQLLQKIFLKSILRKASLIITNSKSTSKDVASFYPAGNTKTVDIYLGRDENIVRTERPADIIKYTAGKPYFLFTGTIEPRKNLVCLLEAFKQFKKESGLEHRLLIVGQKGWKSKSFFQKLKEHPFKDDIILTGYVDRNVLPILYTCATAFVFPSYYEGFGLPVVEALSCGTPCLLAETSSLPEVGGDASLYFNPDDSQTLARLMQELVENKTLRQELSDKAVKQANEFSWKNYVSRFNNEIERLLQG